MVQPKEWLITINIELFFFNESNDIEEAPDTKFVRHTDFYFPGTFIYANIIL